MSDQTAPRRPMQRTNPTVQFVDEIPSIQRGPGQYRERASKYDAVYAALQENPGRWAYIGEGDGLYGALTGYRKRRQLDNLTIANRAGKVYAGVDIPKDEDTNDQGTTDQGTQDDGTTQGYQEGDENDPTSAPVADDGSPSGAPETPQNAAPTTVPGDDGWA